MSREIDERVVQMKFENGTFEKNIQTSIHSLDELKKGLDFKDASKGFDQLDRSASNVDLNPVLQAVQKLDSHFNFFGITAINVMNRISNAAINTGEKLLKSLTIDQITPGWSKYENKTSSVQTIMAATAKQFSDTAVQMETVNEQLNKLNWFTDETSYNFVDMVNNIGKFTSNNIGLEESVTAMQGIATWAAKSGANANEASRAMYNLAQALATGTVKLIDWKSIENANMATTEFKETVITIAEQMGKLQKVSENTWKVIGTNAEVSVSNFNENLSKGWFTKDVLMTALNKYGAATNELNKISEKYGMTASSLIRDIDEYAKVVDEARTKSKELGETEEETQKRITEASKETVEAIAATWGPNAVFEEVAEELAVFDDEVMRFGLKAFKAAQEAKTFTEAIDSVKDAVSTGWMKTYEYLFGDYQHAKEFWTDIANTLYDVFAASGDARNEMLAEWADAEGLNGQAYFIDAIYASLAAILGIMTPIKAAWKAVFGSVTAKSLKTLTVRIRDFMLKLVASEETMEKITRIFRGLFSVLDLIRTVIGELVGGALQSFRYLMSTIGIDVWELAASAGDVVYYFTQWIKQSGIIRVVINALANALGSAIISIKNFIKQLSEWGPTQKAIEAFQKIAVAAFGVIGNAVYILVDIVYWLYQQLQNFHLPNSFDEVKQFFVDFARKVGESFEKIGFANDTLGKGFGVLGSIISSTVGTIVSVFAVAASGVESLMGVFSSYADKVDWAGVLLAFFGVTTIALLWKLTTAMNSFATSLANVTGVGKQAGNAFKAISGYFTALTKSIQANTIFKTSIAIAALAAACGLLAQLDWKGVLAGGGAILMIALAVSVLTKRLDEWSTKHGSMDGKGMLAMTKFVVAFAASVALTAAALNMIDVSDMDALGKKIAVLIGVLASFTVATTLFSIFAKPIELGAGALIGIAASVAIMVLALKTIKPEDAPQILGILPVVTAIMLVMAALTRLMSVTSKMVSSQGDIITSMKNGSGFMSIIGLVLGLKLMISAIKQLGTMQPDIALKGILLMIPLVIGIQQLMKYINISGSQAHKAGKMVMYISVAINLLYFAIKNMAKLSVDEIVKGGGIVTALMLFTGLLARFASPTSINAAFAGKVGLMVMEIAASLMFIQLVVKTLGKMDPIEAIQGTAAVAVILVAIGKMLGSIQKQMSADLLGLQAMTKVMVIVGMISALVIALTYIDPVGALAVCVGLAAMFYSLNAMFASLDLLRTPDMKTIGAVLGILVVVGGILGALSKMAQDWKTALAVAGGLTLVMVSIGVLFVAMGAMMKLADKSTGGLTDKKFVPMAKILARMAIIVGGYAFLVALVGSENIDAKSIGALTACLGGLMICFGLMSGIMGSMKGKPDDKNVNALVKTINSLAIIVGAFAAIAGIANGFGASVSDVIWIATGMSEIMLSLGVMAKMLNGNIPSFNMGVLKELTFLVAAITGIMAMIAIYASTHGADLSNVLTLARSMSLLLLALGASSRLLNGLILLPDWKTLSGLILMVGLLGGLLVGLANWSKKPEALMPLATGMTMLLAGVAVAAFALASAGVAGTLALPALPIVLGIIAALGAITIAIAAFQDEIGDVSGAADAMINIGKGIGGFIGGIIGGLAEGLTSGFKDAAKNISDGMVNLQPFFTIIKEDMPENILELGKRLVDLVSMIANPQFKTNIKQFKGVADALAANGGNLESIFSTFGAAMKAFADACGDIDMEAVTKGVEAATKLSALEAGLPGKDGLMSTILGDDDLESFGSRLRQLGYALWQFSIYGKLIDTKAVDQAVTASKKLQEIESKLPDKDGRLQKFTGQDGFDKFGERLAMYGAALVRFSDAVSGQAEGSTGLAISAINNAITATQQLSDIENALESKGSVIGGIFFGNSDFKSFGDRLTDYGDALASFSEKIAGNIDLIAIGDAIGATERLSELEETLNTHGGWDAFWNGDNTFGQFGTNLKGLGVALQSFATNISKIEWQNIDTAIGYIERMTAIEKVEEASKQTLSAAKTLMTDIVDVIKAQKKPIKDEAYDMAYWLAEGFAAGMVAYEQIALKAAINLANSIISAMNAIFQINSPSVVMNEMGHWVVKGLGEGITEDMSAEEAAEQKAQDIITAFQNGLSKMNTKLDISNLEYQLWEKTEGLTATESEKASKELEQEVEKLKAKAQEVSMMRTAMNAVLETAGEESEAYQTAYKNYLQSQIDMYDQKAIVDQLNVDQLNAANQTWAEQAQKFAQLQADNAEAFKFMGKSEEELRQWAAEQVGASFARQLEVNNVMEEYRDAFDRLGYSQEERIEQAEKILGPETREQVKNTLYDTTAIIEEAMNETSYTLEMAVSKSVSGAVGKGGASGAAIGAADLGESVQEQINNAMDNIEIPKMEGWDALTGISDFFNDPGALSDKISNFFNGENGILSQFQSASQPVTDAVGNWFGDITSSIFGEEKAKEWAAGARKLLGMDGVQGGLTDAESVKKVLEAGEDIGDAGIEGLENSISGGSEGGNSRPYDDGVKVDEEYAGGMTDPVAVKTVTDNAEDVAEAGNQAMADETPEYEATGENVSLGFAHGITKRTRDVVVAARMSATAAKEEFARVFDVASPSRVTEEIGGYVSQGLALGMLSKKFMVENSAEEVANSTITAFDYTKSLISEVLSNDEDFAPTITPVLDLDQLTSDAKSIPGLLNHNSTLNLGATARRANQLNASITQNRQNGTDLPGQTNYTFTQNNYSPKALDRLEIYRQTQNQFAQLKGATKIR